MIELFRNDILLNKQKQIDGNQAYTRMETFKAFIKFK